MTAYDPQKRTQRPRADDDAPAPVDELLAEKPAAEPHEPAEPTPPPLEYAAETPPSGGGNTKKFVGIGVAVTALLFTLRWVLKRRHRDD